jgi:hypothetical protein
VSLFSKPSLQKHRWTTKEQETKSEVLRRRKSYTLLVGNPCKTLGKWDDVLCSPLFFFFFLVVERSQTHRHVHVEPRKEKKVCSMFRRREKKTPLSKRKKKKEFFDFSSLHLV